MERAIAEINDAGARHRRVLGRSDHLRLQGGVRPGEALPRPDRVRVARRRPGQPRLAQRRLRPLRGALRRAQLGAPQGRRRRWSRSTRPSPTSTTGRSGAAATAGSRRSSRPSRPSCASSCCTTTCCPIPGTGRERNVVYDAGDAIECLQRAGVNLVLSGHKHVPYAWKLENLFVVNTGTVSTLRLRGNTRPCYNVVEVCGIARRRLAALSVPRPGADHPVRPRDARVREVHRADRARGDGAPVRAVALIDGEHYAPVVRDALRALPYEWVGAILVGRHREAARRRGVRRAARRRLRGRGGRGRPLRRARARAGRADALGLARARRRACPTSAPTSASTRRRYEPFELPSIAVIGTGKRVGKTAVTTHLARLLARDRSVVVVAMGRGGPPEPEVVETPAVARGARRALARRPARRVRPPGDRRARRRADDRVPARGRGPGRRGLRLERRGGRQARRPARSRRRRSSTAAAPRSRRSTSTAGCSWSAAARPATTT